MKLYVASKYENKKLIQEVAKRLKKAGFDLTSAWHSEHYAADVQLADVPFKRLREIALRDIAQMDEAQAYLVITDDCKISRGGMHFENGYMFASGKKIYVVGEKITLFHYLPGTEHFGTLEEFIARVEI